MARHLLRVLGYLEARAACTFDAVYIRTYHNELADACSREAQDELTIEVAARGFERIDPKEAWAEALGRWAPEAIEFSDAITGEQLSVLFFSDPIHRNNIEFHIILCQKSFSDIKYWHTKLI